MRSGSRQPHPKSAWIGQVKDGQLGWEPLSSTSSPRLQLTDGSWRDLSAPEPPQQFLQVSFLSLSANGSVSRRGLQPTVTELDAGEWLTGLAEEGRPHSSLQTILLCLSLAVPRLPGAPGPSTCGQSGGRLTGLHGWRWSGSHEVARAWPAASGWTRG